jgi:hypothetical protein
MQIKLLIMKTYDKFYNLQLYNKLGFFQNISKKFQIFKKVSTVLRTSQIKH